MNDASADPQKALSADGTEIAYERVGSGPPLVVIGGAMADRRLTGPTAAAIAARGYDVINFDRRGRGDSTNAGDPSVEREIEDLAALSALADASSLATYAHSSGAGLALQAAAAGVLRGPLVLHEAPYNLDVDAMKDDSRAWSQRLDELLEEGRGGEAVAEFMTGTGMPEEMITEMQGTDRWAELERMAPSLALDSKAMGDAEGATVPREIAAQVANRTLVLSGDAGPDWMLAVARELADALPDGQLEVLSGEGHVVDPERLADVLDPFLGQV